MFLQLWSSIAHQEIEAKYAYFWFFLTSSRLSWPNIRFHAELDLETDLDKKASPDLT